MLERDSAAEYFLSLCDEALAAVAHDSLREEVESVEYRLEAQEDVAISAALRQAVEGSAAKDGPKEAAQAPRSATLALLDLESMLLDCHDCEAWLNRTDALSTGRGARNPVFLFVVDHVAGDGSFMGEHEKAFFDKWMQALHLDVSRECHFTSVIKCPSQADTIWKGCEDLLKRQIELLDPRVVVMLGSAGCFLATGSGDILAARGSVHEYCGHRTVCSFSPAQVLADYQGLRRPVWEDLKLAALLAGTDDRLK